VAPVSQTVNGCNWDNPRFRVVADRLLAPVAVLDSDTTILYVNPAATAVLEADASQLLGHPLVRFVHPDDNERVRRDLCDVTAGRAGRSIGFRIRVNRREEWTVVESIADNLLDDPSIEGIVLSIRDVTAQHALQRQLRDAAYVDALTSLPNRLSIIEQLEKLMSGTGDISVAFVGIDRFDLINHSFGHSLGDSVLLSVVGRLQSCLPSATILGRLTGNVFVVVIADATAAHARAIAWRALERVGEPLFLGGHELRLSLSAGLAYRDPAATATSLLRDADLALRRAMGDGGGRVESFVTEMRDEAIGRLELEARMRRAIAHAEFSLEVQPIVRIADATAVCAEALVRWKIDGIAADPRTFIKVAEETGLIVPLGDWIIDRAAQIATRVPGSRIMVNLSARQLGSPGLPERIARVLAARRVPASAMGFEVTETLLIEHFDFAVHTLSAIRQLGCSVGLDDFGTGYSSLSYLRRLPIDFLKIDGSLSADIDKDDQSRAIVGAIITMSDAMGLEAICECVETEAQVATLRELGCTLAQGYLYGRPAPVPERPLRGGANAKKSTRAGGGSSGRKP
jgi:diguanylate cyclase (GGDEF)-like protein/PAS domain S-box-containing protein